MNRRIFIASAAAVATLPLATLATLGCGASQGTIAAIVTTIGAGLSATFTAAGISGAAADILKYAQAAASAVASWVPGTPGQDVVQALNDFIANIYLLPTGNATVLAVVQNAVSTVLGLLADFGVTPAVLTAAVRTHAAMQTVSTKYPSNAALKAALADFKTAHNRIVKADAKFATAVVK